MFAVQSRPKNRIKHNKYPEGFVFFFFIYFHFVGEGGSHFYLGTRKFKQHHPPFTEAQHRMLSQQMFSLPRTAHHLLFLLALWGWLSTEEPQLWSLALPPTWPTQTYAESMRYNVIELGSEKATQVRSKRAEARSAGPRTVQYKQNWAWPPGIGTLSQWKRLCKDDSASTQHKKTGEMLLCPKQFPDYSKQAC